MVWKIIDIFIFRVGEVIKYVKAFLTRYKKFEDYVKFEKIKSKRILYLDVTTKWHSMYLMLGTAIRFEIAFER